MKIIIPMAGYGKRMRPLTYSRPKPLVNVAGEPMLKHLLDAVAELEADEYIFIVGYLGDQIEAYVNENYDITAHFVVQEELIGQAHAIYLAKELIDGPVIVLFSDTLFEADLSIIKTTAADALAFVQEVEDPRRFGVVELNDDGQVVGFVEKPESMDNRNAVIGLYYLREGKDMIRAIETQMARNQMTKGEFYIADAFQIMVEEGAVFRTGQVDAWMDCGKPETVLETSAYLLKHHLDNSADVQREGVAIIPPVYIHPDADVKHAVIGPNVAISEGCYVRSSVIKNSILDKDAEVVNMILDDTLLGINARVVGRMQQFNLGDTATIDFAGLE